ncbi:hypothetical protein ACP4OV_007767 [Aristida adscensionis]
MPLFLSAAASAILPLPSLTLTPPPHYRRRCFLPAPCSASASSRPPPRRPYRRRRRDAPTRPPTPTPAPTPQRPRPQPQQQQQSAANAAPRGARDQEELEAAIYDFMRRSAKPGAFPTREELVAAGRADLAAAVASSGGWLALGWSSGAEGTGAASGVGVHPDYPPEAGGYYRDLAPGAGGDTGREEVVVEEEEEEDDDDDEDEPSPSGREPQTVEPREVRFKAGLEGMLTRLQRDRERARPLSHRINGARRINGAGARSDNGALVGSGSIHSYPVAGDRHTPGAAENGNIDGSHPQNETLEGNNALRNSSNDAWQKWTLGKGGLSDFEAAEILPTVSRKSSEHDDIDIELVQDGVHRSPNGVAVSNYPSDGVDSERDEINSRLQTLELDLTDALKTLRSRFDKVLSDVSNGNGETLLDGISDDWEFEETKVMQAQEELRSIRAKIAVLEGKMALEIIERNKIIEEKQRRLDEVEKALSELRTVYIVWPNPASEVLLVGSFDGWTTQRKMDRSDRGIFSLNLRLYPGRYEIKFIVDGVWKNDPLRPTVYNNGHENNLLVVT